MDLLKCYLLLLALLGSACFLQAIPTITKSKITVIEKPAFLQNPTEIFNTLSAKFVKPKPVFVKPIIVKPIVVVKPVIGGGGAGNGGHGHGHHGKNKFLGKFAL